MIAHLCRLVWNRRRTNLLLIGELTLVFLVVAPMGVGWTLFAIENAEPLGFEYEDVWVVNLGRHNWMSKADPEQASTLERTIQRVKREIQALDAVESVALAEHSPFSRRVGVWNGITSVVLSEEGLETLGLRLHSGRWFAPEDAALAGDSHPVVLDRRLSRALFGDRDPLGEVIQPDADAGSYLVMNMSASYRLKLRVVGVVENCFYYGKYGASESEMPGLLFFFLSQEQHNTPTPKSASDFYLLVKTPWGARPDFGEKLSTRVRAVVPADQNMRFDVRSLAEIQAESQARRVSFLNRAAVLSGLLMFAVVLGLTGIMWQNVRRRTAEVGVRRAVGAVGGNIYGLFLGELAVLATAAIALGCVPIVQFDLLGLLLESQIPAHVLASGVGATALMLYLLVLLCGLYPSWLAAKVRPAEALHYE